MTIAGARIGRWPRIILGCGWSNSLTMDRSRKFQQWVGGIITMSNERRHDRGACRPVYSYYEFSGPTRGIFKRRSSFLREKKGPCFALLEDTFFLFKILFLRLKILFKESAS
jgi:hypothetical protein